MHRSLRRSLLGGRSALFAPRQHLILPRSCSRAFFSFGSSSSKTDTAEKPPPAFLDTFTDPRLDALGNKVLYVANQELTCRIMLSAASFNLFYWTYYLSTCWYYQDVVVQGVALAGDPRWGFFGAFGTGIMFYVTQQYSSHTAFRCYESADGARLGFQMHTMLGKPGRKIECSVGNAYLMEGSSSRRSKVFGSSYMPLRVKGVDKNILIDRTGSYFVDAHAVSQVAPEADLVDPTSNPTPDPTPNPNPDPNPNTAPNPAPRLLALLRRGEDNMATLHGGIDPMQVASDKESRVRLRKEQAREGKNKRAKSRRWA